MHNQRICALVLLALGIAARVAAVDYTWNLDANDGDWTNPANWWDGTAYGSGVPSGAGDTAVILATVNGSPSANIPAALTLGSLTVSANWNSATLAAFTGALVVDAGAAFTTGTNLSITGSLTLNAAGSSVTLGNTLSVSGNLTVNNGSFGSSNFDVAVGGNFANNAGAGGLTLGSSTVTFDGTGNQTLLMGGSTAGSANFVVNKSAATMTFSDALTAGTVTITASGGVTFSSNLTAGTVTFTDTTGTIACNGNVSITTNLNTAANAYNVSLNAGALGQTSTVAGATTFNNTGSLLIGNNAADSITFTGGVTATAPSAVNLAGTIATGGGAGQNISLGDGDTGVVLVANATLDAGAGDITAGGAVSGAFALSLTAAGGTVSVASTNGTPTGLTVTAATFTTTGSVTVSAGNAISITTDQINLGNTLGNSGAGSITLEPAANGTTIGLGDPAGTFNLTGTELGFLSTTGTVTIGRSLGTAAITIGGSGALNLAATSYNLLIEGSSCALSFAAATLTLGNNRTLTLSNGGNITVSSGATHVAIGGTGTLIIAQAGSVGAFSAALETNVTIIRATVTNGIYISEVNAVQLGDGGGGVTTSGGQIDISSGGALTFNNTVSTTGAGTAISLAATAGGMTISQDILAANNAQINLSTGGGGSITRPSAGTVGAAGSTSLLVISSAGSVGASGAALATNVGTIRASAGGDIYINEASALQLGDASGPVTTSNGLINISTAGNLSSGVWAGGDIVSTTGGAGAITLVTTAGGTMSISDTLVSVEGGLVTLTNAGLLTLSSNITARGGLTQNGAGTVSMGLTITTTGDVVNFLRAVTLASACVIDTTDGGGSVAGASITFQNSVSGAQNLSLYGGTSGTITFTGAVGGPNLTALTVNSALSVVFSNTAAFAGPVSISSNEINVNGGAGSFSGNNTLSLSPLSAGQAIAIGGAADTGVGTLDLTATDIAALVDGFSSITIGSASGTGAVTVSGATAFWDPVSIQTPLGAGSITVSAQLTGSGNASIVLDAGTGGVSLGASIVTAGNPITIDDNALVSANISLDTTNGGAVPAGALITLNGTLDGSSADTRQLILRCGQQTLTVSNAIGATNRFAVLTIRADDLVLSAALRAQTINLYTGTPASRAMLVGAAGGGLFSLADAELGLLAGFSSLVIGENTQQAASVTLRTVASPVPTAAVFIYANSGAASVVLDDEGSSTALATGGVGTITIAAGTGSITASSASNAFAELSSSGTINLASAGSIGAAANRIQFPAGQTNVSVTNAPNGVWLDGIGSLTLAAITTNSTGAAGLDVTTNGLFTLSGAVSTATGNISFNPGGNGVTANNTVNGNSLTITNGGAVDLNNAITVPSGFSCAGTSFDNTGATITTTNNSIVINHSAAVTIGAALSSGSGIVNIDSSGSTIALNAAINVSTGAVTIDAAGLTTVTAAGAISATGAAPVAFGATLTGTVATAGNVTTTGGSIRYYRAIEFTGNVSFDSTNAGGFAAGASIQFDGALTRDGTARNLTARAGTAGNVVFAGTVGTGGAPLGALLVVSAANVAGDAGATVDAGAITAASLTQNAGSGTTRLGAVTLSGAMSITGAVVDLNGTIAAPLGFSSTGTSFDNTGATITTTNNSIVINHSGSVTIGAALSSGSGIVNIDSSGSTIALNAAINVSTGAVTIDAAGLTTVTAAGAISATGAAPVSFGATLTGTVATAGNITTAGGSIRYYRAIVLAGNVSFDSTNAGGFAAGASIQFDGALTRDGTARNLTARAGTAGNVVFAGTVGTGGAPLGALLVVSAANVAGDAGATVDAGAITAASLTQNAGSGTTRLGAVTLSGAMSITGAAVDLNGTIAAPLGFSSTGTSFDNTGATITTTNNSIVINHSATVTIGAALSAGSGIVNIDSSGSTIALNAAINVSTGAVTLDAAGLTTVTAAGVISATGAAPVSFGATLTGTVAASGNITTAGGSIRYYRAIELTGNVSLDSTNAGGFAAGASIQFDGALTRDGTARNLTARAGTAGNVVFAGTVGTGGAPLGALLVVSAANVAGDVGATVDAGAITAASLTQNAGSGTTRLGAVTLSGAMNLTGSVIDVNGTTIAPGGFSSSASTLNINASMTVGAAITATATGAITISNSNITSTGIQTWTALAQGVRVTGGGTWQAGGAGISLPNTDLFLDHNGATLLLSANLSCRNLYFYRGNFNIAGRTLSTSANAAIWGAAYSSDDAEWSGANTRHAYFPTATLVYYPANGTYNAGTGAFSTATNAAFAAGGLAGATLTIGGNFYDNGASMNQGACTLNIPANANSNPLYNTTSAVTASQWGTPYAVAFNLTAQNVTATGGFVGASTAGQGITNGGGNTAWQFGRPAISWAATVYDDVIRIEFNTAIENSNNEISAALVGSTLRAGINGATYTITGTYTNAGCTLTTNGAGDLQYFFVRASGRWNTDATGVSGGAAISTDRSNNHLSAVADVSLLKGVLYAADGKTMVQNYNFNGNPAYAGTVDRCRPVLVGVDIGQAAHSLAPYQNYDGHNYVQLKYSEPVNIGTSPGFTIADASAQNIKSQNNFSIATEYGGFITGAGTLTLAGYGTVSGTVSLNSRDAVNAADYEVNGLYRAGPNAYGSHGLYISVAGWSFGLNPDLYWPGYFDTATTAPSGNFTSIYNDFITDASGNPIEPSSDTNGGSIAIASAAGGATYFVNYAKPVVTIAGSWDTVTPEIVYNIMQGDYDIVPFVYTGGETRIEAFEIRITEAVRDTSLTYPTTGTIPITPSAFMFRADGAAFGYRYGGNAFSTWVQAPYFGNTNVKDDQFFTILNDTLEADWRNTSQFYFTYDATTGLVTDWAGNLLPDYTTAPSEKACIEKIPPRIRLTTAIEGDTKIYVVFTEPILKGPIGSPTTVLVPADFSISGTDAFSITGITVLNLLGTGVIDAYINVNRPITTSDMLYLQMNFNNTIIDLRDNPADTSLRRAVDVGMGVINVVAASDGIHTEATGSDTTLTVSQLGTLRVFDGTGRLYDRDITIYAALDITHTGSYTDAAIASVPLTMYFDGAFPVDSSLVFSITGRNTELAYWLPVFKPGYNRVGNIDSRPLAPVFAAPLPSTNRNFLIPSVDSDMISGATIGFLFRLGDLFLARESVPGDPRSFALWEIRIQDVVKQKGGVTILNNVINSLKRERTTVQLDLAEGGQVTVIVFTLDGDVVTTLHRGRLGAGTYNFTWDGTNLAGLPVARGIYFIRVVGPGIDEIRKVIVIKE